MAEVDLRRQLPLHLTWLLGIVSTYLSWRVMGDGLLGRDAHAYWAAWQGAMYDAPPGTLDAYNYSPAFAQAIWLPAQLPWPAFGVLVAVASVVALTHLLRPLGWRWVFPLLLCCMPEIMSGNVFWLLAVVAAYGVRHPWLWSIPLLTKVTPGLGPLWFLLRREWRPLLIALGATAAIACVSYVTMPGAWVEWYDFLTSNAGGAEVATGSELFPPLVVRLPFALALLTWAALTDRRWGLPVAMVLATPVTGIAALTMLAALPRLMREDAAV